MSRQDGSGRQTRFTLHAATITLLDVLVSIESAVALGISIAWWMRLPARVAKTAGRAVAVSFHGTRTAMVARLGDWMTGRSSRCTEGGSGT